MQTKSRFFFGILMKTMSSSSSSSLLLLTNVLFQAIVTFMISCPHFNRDKSTNFVFEKNDEQTIFFSSFLSSNLNHTIEMFIWREKEVNMILITYTTLLFWPSRASWLTPWKIIILGKNYRWLNRRSVADVKDNVGRIETLMSSIQILIMFL